MKIQRLLLLTFLLTALTGCQKKSDDLGSLRDPHEKIERLKQEISSNQAEEIFALLVFSSEGYKDIVIRVIGGEATVTYYHNLWMIDRKFYPWKKTLSATEWNNAKSIFIQSEHLKPYEISAGGGLPSYHYVYLTKTKEVCFYMYGVGVEKCKPKPLRNQEIIEKEKPYEKLNDAFYDLTAGFDKAKHMKAYWEEEKKKEQDDK